MSKSSPSPFSRRNILPAYMSRFIFTQQLNKNTINLNVCNLIFAWQGEMSGLRNGQENVRVLCCSFQQYLHCSQQVVGARCGADSASFTREFLERMSGALVQTHCQPHQPGTQQCSDLGVMARSGAASLTVCILLSSTFIIWFF